MRLKEKGWVPRRGVKVIHRLPSEPRPWLTMFCPRIYPSCSPKQTCSAHQLNTDCGSGVTTDAPSSSPDYQSLAELIGMAEDMRDKAVLPGSSSFWAALTQKPHIQCCTVA